MPEQVQHTLYRVSTATALVEGIYQGAVQVAILAVTLAFLREALDRSWGTRFEPRMLPPQSRCPCSIPADQ